ncbi:interleukin enhancer-binding factor 2 homolog isoform X2 [Halichondria panicea]|uniref:interleukin enhancer-binding factor 2 homolog isoform X2 n=1 Tax=Halichondria panicea TaxID=6063 RepID=UPI00312BB3FF
MAQGTFRGHSRGHSRGLRSKGNWRGRGRGKGGWHGPVMQPPSSEPEFYPLVRPIFDWTEVEEHFPQAPTVLDNSLLEQLLVEHAASLVLPPEEQSALDSFVQKLCTLVDNMIVSGEGESMLLDEVRVVGAHKMGIAMAPDKVVEIVILLKDLPTPALMSKISGTLVESLETARREDKDGFDMGQVTMANEFDYSFEIHGGKIPVAKVYLTSTGEKVYGGPRRDRMISDMTPFEKALKMIRHSRWWEDHTHHLQCAHDLVRVLIDMKNHVPGLQYLSTWYIQLLIHCSVVPLIGDEPLSFVGAFKRVWELLSAGLFLPGSVGVPDPCEKNSTV